MKENMKILIIKLGALGDVVRTLPIVVALKEKYPDSEITWITKKNASEIVKSSPYVDEVIEFEDASKINEKFNLLYNFDIEPEATTLAKNINSDRKYGFNEQGGYAVAFNFSAEYYLNTLFDDEFKKNNKKTYQEMMFMAAELQYKGQHHPLILSEKDREYSESFAEKNKINTQKLIGIHIGSSPRWPSKSWHEQRVIEFLKKLAKRGYEILLFGGPDEPERLERVYNELKKQCRVYKQDPFCSVMQFASLVNLCNVLICADTLALHISLALKKKTIALFFCTSPDEIEGYGILTKIVSPMLYDFFPEKQDQYSEELVKSISIEQVLKELDKII